MSDHNLRSTPEATRITAPLGSTISIPLEATDSAGLADRIVVIVACGSSTTATRTKAGGLLADPATVAVAIAAADLASSA